MQFLAALEVPHADDRPRMHRPPAVGSELRAVAAPGERARRPAAHDVPHAKLLFAGDDQGLVVERKKESGCPLRRPVPGIVRDGTLLAGGDVDKPQPGNPAPRSALITRVRQGYGLAIG